MKFQTTEKDSKSSFFVLKQDFRCINPIVLLWYLSDRYDMSLQYENSETNIENNIYIIWKT